MTTAQDVEKYADEFGDSYPATVVYLRQYAALIKTYADAVAENARLKAAMDKYSEDEVLGKLRGELLLRCCIEICQEESTDNGTAQKIEARIRDLKVERSPYEVMAEGNHSIGVFKDGKLIAADADVFMPPKERRKCERRICDINGPDKRSGTDRRKK